MKRFVFYLVLFSIALLLIEYDDCSEVYAAGTGISVNNYAQEPEKAFTAEDLRRILDKSLSVNKTEDKDKKESSEKSSSETENDRENETIENEADKNEQKDNKPQEKDTDDTTVSENEAEETGYYVPPKEDEWLLLLVNKQNPIPDDYSPELTDVNGSIKIRSEIALPLSEMFDAAQEDGVTLMVCSAYRSHDYQQGLFDRKIRNYTGRGLSYLDAFRLGSYSVIIPGTSEHELGMALDIVTPSYMSLNDGFADTKAGKWLKDNAYKYGFILRYPEGKEYITGIIFEPWHYRYVGKEAAQAIEESGLTLEEYVEEIGYHYN